MLFFQILLLIIKSRNKQDHKYGLNDKSSYVKKKPVPFRKTCYNNKKHPEKHHNKKAVKKCTKPQHIPVFKQDVN